jgi:predicted ATPase
MINSINFNNYKCLKNDFTFNLGRINVFSGYNGRGKSSVMQALLMLSQSIVEGDLTSINHLHLNGNFVQLGDYDEILSDDKIDELGFNITFNTQDSKDHRVELGYFLSDDIKVAELKRCKIDDDDYFASVGKVQPTNKTEDSTLQQLPSYVTTELLPRLVHFVSANRKGPIKYVDKRERPENPKVGINGEYTINTLHEYKGTISPKMNVLATDTHEYDLMTATSMWIDFIMDGGSVDVEKAAENNSDFGKKKTSVLSMGFKFAGIGNNRTFNSYNVGYGYSYIMSIVVTALISKPGSIVMIENPEAHLHPQAQLNLTYMLSRLAATGVQIFVETHSEHVLNGFRLAALKPEYDITNDDLELYFFDNNYEVSCLKIERNGKINNWPKRFFDQYQHELAEIISLGSKL